jgi:hypothetical protein
METTQQNTIEVTITFTDPVNKHFKINLSHQILNDYDVEKLKKTTNNLIDRSASIINQILISRKS